MGAYLILELISKSEFARRKHVTPSAVDKAIASGRISYHKKGKKLDWHSQEDAWERNADPAQRKDIETPKDFAAAKLEKEIYLGKRQRLAFERDSRKVVEIESVRTEIFKQTRLLRDVVLAIPDRVSSAFTARVVEYLRPILAKHLGSKLDTVLAEIKVSDIERISLRFWEKEGREALERFGNGPRI